MARFIDQPPGDDKKKQGRALQTTQARGGKLAAPLQRLSPLSGGTGKGRLPNASIIYGIAAAALFVVSLIVMIKLANWFTGLLLLILSATLFGYAAYFARYR